MAYLSVTFLMIVGIFLILLVLVQRGRGGGLAGAFGGMGGQSAFGTKAGDVFTRITIVAAVLWVLLAGASIHALRPTDTYIEPDKGPSATSATDDDAVPTAEDKETIGEGSKTDTDIKPEETPKSETNSSETKPENSETTEPGTSEASKPGPELPNPNDAKPADKKPEEAEPESTDKKDNE